VKELNNKNRKNGEIEDYLRSQTKLSLDCFTTTPRITCTLVYFNFILLFFVCENSAISSFLMSLKIYTIMVKAK